MFLPFPFLAECSVYMTTVIRNGEGSARSTRVSFLFWTHSEFQRSKLVLLFISVMLRRALIVSGEWRSPEVVVFYAGSPVQRTHLGRVFEGMQQAPGRVTCRKSS